MHTAGEKILQRENHVIEWLREIHKSGAPGEESYMNVKYEGTVTAIGKLARKFLETNNSVILLDEGAHPNLAEMVVEHTPGELKGDIAVGDTFSLGKQKYKVTRIGENVNDTIRESGHCTLLFNAKGSMPGQIELEGGAVPPLSQGQKFAFAGK